jgi:hypothetical protein
MDKQNFKCENCGAPLLAEDAICARCDSELKQPNVDPNNGRYRCPHCNCKFENPNEALWPPSAKWYQPQSPRPQCPHCHAYLRDKTVIYRSPMELVWTLLVISASVFSPWKPGTQIMLLVIFCTVEVIRWHRIKLNRQIGENRYELECLPNSPFHTDANRRR